MRGDDGRQNDEIAPQSFGEYMNVENTNYQEQSTPPPPPQNTFYNHLGSSSNPPAAAEDSDAASLSSSNAAPQYHEQIHQHQQQLPSSSHESVASLPVVEQPPSVQPQQEMFDRFSAEQLHHDGDAGGSSRHGYHDDILHSQVLLVFCLSSKRIASCFIYAIH